MFCPRCGLGSPGMKGASGIVCQCPDTIAEANKKLESWNNSFRMSNSEFERIKKESQTYDPKISGSITEIAQLRNNNARLIVEIKFLKDELEVVQHENANLKNQLNKTWRSKLFDLIFGKEEI